MTATHNLTCFIGDTLSLTVTFQDSDSVAYSVAAYTFHASLSDGTSFTVDSSLASTGKITISLSATATSTKDVNTVYTYRFWQVNGSEITTQLVGSVSFTEFP